MKTGGVIELDNIGFTGDLNKSSFLGGGGREDSENQLKQMKDREFWRIQLTEFFVTDH